MKAKRALKRKARREVEKVEEEVVPAVRHSDEPVAKKVNNLM